MQELLDKYEIVVGLEVHVQLLTESKIFTSDANFFQQKPNLHISPISLAHPGTLPKLNEKVISYAVKLGLALDCEINRYNIFDRKNYFYPDLPKGFQVTQDKLPICKGGKVQIENRSIQLHHIHLEEDAGKSIHLDKENVTAIDLNRAGVPLLEVVSDPDLHSGKEAYQYLTELRRLVRYLDICDGNMEEGSLRCDANVSVRLKGAEKLGVRAEVKNMNSIRNVQRAIDHEAKRQMQCLENGEEIIGETRTFDAQKGTTASMRLKETLNDYRYLPEPDLQPFLISDTYLEDIRAQMPTLPRELQRKFETEYQLPTYDAKVLTDDKATAQYFEAICKQTKNYKAASNWVMGAIKSHLNQHNLMMEDVEMPPKTIVELILLIDNQKISTSIAAQRLFPEMLKNPNLEVETLAKNLDLLHEGDDSQTLDLIEKIIDQNPDKVAAYRKGKKNLLGMFMGLLLRESKGKLDPKKANELLRKQLEQ